MENSYISKLMRQYLKNRYTPGLEEKVQHWLIDDRHVCEKDSALHTYWDGITTNVDLETYKALARTQKRLGMDISRGNVISMRRKWLRVAAVLLPLMIVGTGYWYFSRLVTMVEVVVNNGQRQQIMLPDGSDVCINAGSTLTYPKRFSGTRTIRLSGEAYFAVAKDPSKPFVVETEFLSVKVLGTEFNVSAYPDDDKTTATLASGKISVETVAGQIRSLQPNQQLTFDRLTSELSISDVLPGHATDWRNGHLVFDNVTLLKILKTMERHYDIIIDTQNVEFSNDRYSVRFTNGETFEQALDILESLVEESIPLKK